VDRDAFSNLDAACISARKCQLMFIHCKTKSLFRFPAVKINLSGADFPEYDLGLSDHEDTL